MRGRHLGKDREREGEKVRDRWWWKHYEFGRLSRYWFVLHLSHPL